MEKRMNVHACLRVDATHEKVLVTLVAENRGERRAWLPRAVAADPAPRGPVFELMVEREGQAPQPVAYAGQDALRDTLTVDDYLELPPHSSHTHTIDITHAYAFAPGEHGYTIRYEGAAVPDIRHPEATAPFATEPVRFRHMGS
jgi:hypothetical protein